MKPLAALVTPAPQSGLRLHPAGHSVPLRPSGEPYRPDDPDLGFEKEAHPATRRLCSGVQPPSWMTLGSVLSQPGGSPDSTTSQEQTGRPDTTWTATILGDAVLRHRSSRLIKCVKESERHLHSTRTNRIQNKFHFGAEITSQLSILPLTANDWLCVRPLIVNGAPPSV